MGKMAERGFWLACSVCRRRNYTSTKNKKNNPDKLKLRKYCPFCRRHTEHLEVALSARR